jgi:two-component system sensor histidine kinase PhcS
MPDPSLINQPEFKAAFLANEQQQRISTGKVASALVMILMPAGVALDYFVYRDEMGFFLVLRLVCSALAAVLWFLHTTSFGERNCRLLGLPIALLPAFFIAWMIYVTEGPSSPYYAGLNLILLAVSVVVHWSVRESVLAVSTVILMYMIASLANNPGDLRGIFFSNLILMIETGIIVVTGNYFFNRLRFREFALRYELDKNRKALEASLQQLKENELQLVQSEKLASLGRMSAGIIHEINNPLNFATTGLFTLRKKGKNLASGQQEEFTDILDDVEEGIKRVQTIVSDLRMFTHPDTEARERVKMAEVVSSALRLLSNEWRDKIRVEQDVPENQTVWANKNKLIQVCVNLLQNSLDALSRKSFNGDVPTIQIQGRTENGKNLIIIRDNGMGIDPKHLDKIFDPFFTTKDVGKGMGLGLSICHRIVQEYEGRIAVNSEPGEFCEFMLEFPAQA